MNIDPKLLAILVCPENRLPVTPAPDEVIDEVNSGIRRGQVKNRNGEIISEELDGGLMRQDGQVLYPVREDIPVMLIEEGIPLSGASR